MEQIRESLSERGFYQSAEDEVICRFRYEDLKIDVMSTESVGWAPSNPWFKKGFSKGITVNLDGIIIKVLPLPYFLATKMEAFFNRGIKDVYASHDLEDIVYLFNYTSDIDAQVLASNKVLLEYLSEKLLGITENRNILTAIRGSLYYEQADERMEIIKGRFQNIINGI